MVLEDDDKHRVCVRIYESRWNYADVFCMRNFSSATLITDLKKLLHVNDNHARRNFFKHHNIEVGGEEVI